METPVGFRQPRSTPPCKFSHNIPDCGCARPRYGLSKALERAYLFMNLQRAGTIMRKILTGSCLRIREWEMRTSKKKWFEALIESRCGCSIILALHTQDERRKVTTSVEPGSAPNCYYPHTPLPTFVPTATILVEDFEMPNTSRIKYMAPHGYIRSFPMVAYCLYLSLVRHPDRNLNYSVRSIGAAIVAGSAGRVETVQIRRECIGRQFV
jgi:hypothetical protein